MKLRLAQHLLVLLVDLPQPCKDRLLYFQNVLIDIAEIILCILLLLEIYLDRRFRLVPQLLALLRMVIHLFELQVNSTIVAFHVYDLFVCFLSEEFELGAVGAPWVGEQFVSVLIQLVHVGEHVCLHPKVVVAVVVVVVAEDP